MKKKLKKPIPTFRRMEEPAPDTAPERTDTTKEMAESSLPESMMPIRYDPEWRITRSYNPFTMIPRIFDLCSQGCSKVEIMADLGLSANVMDNWEKEHPEFAEAMQKASLINQAWWERAGRLNLSNPQFNASLWMMNMSNRFGWTRRIDGRIESNSTTTETKRLEVSVTDGDYVQKRSKVIQILREAGALTHLLTGKPEVSKESEDSPEKDVIDLVEVKSS